jgi:GDP/UDP-N,N'-diacetylbacillosamine 2-epimerase (hydrolysing)
LAIASVVVYEQQVLIDCPADRKSITKAINQLFSPSFLATLPSIQNPYGSGGASEAIVKILERTAFDNLLKKRFFDVVCQ